MSIHLPNRIQSWINHSISTSIFSILFVFLSMLEHFTSLYWLLCDSLLFISLGPIPILISTFPNYPTSISQLIRVFKNLLVRWRPKSNSPSHYEIKLNSISQLHNHPKHRSIFSCQCSKCANTMKYHFIEWYRTAKQLEMVGENLDWQTTFD